MNVTTRWICDPLDLGSCIRYVMRMYDSNLVLDSEP
jgi:hypothetical protein